MTDYKPFLIQKLKTFSPTRDSKEWSIWVKHVPFKVFPRLKAPPKRSWMDEDGDDEFIPDTPYYEAYEMECEFVYIGQYETANAQIKSFLSYLATDGAFKIYDTYTKIGRTNVRYVGYNEESLWRRYGNEDVVVFKVTLKINDPITDITL